MNAASGWPLSVADLEGRGGESFGLLGVTPDDGEPGQSEGVDPRQHRLLQLIRQAGHDVGAAVHLLDVAGLGARLPAPVGGEEVLDRVAEPRRPPSSPLAVRTNDRSSIGGDIGAYATLLSTRTMTASSPVASAMARASSASACRRSSVLPTTISRQYVRGSALGPDRPPVPAERRLKMATRSRRSLRSC